MDLPSVSLEKLAERYLASQKSKVTELYLDHQRRQIQRFFDRCPVEGTAEVSPEHVRRFLDSLTSRRPR